VILESGGVASHDVLAKFNLFSLSFSFSNYNFNLMEISSDDVAEAVLNEFNKWPQKRKPLLRGDGIREWVPLSGIVAQGWLPKDVMQITRLTFSTGRGSLTCLAAA
jgi:hypothetical protein